MERNLSIDILKVILAIGVVFLHIHIFSDISTLLSHVFVQGIFRLAVPVFLVITGYYFFYINSIQKYKTWLKRVFILYVVWMIFYLPIWWTKSSAYNFSVLYNGYYVLWYIQGLLLGGSLLYFCRNIKTEKLFIGSVVLFLFGVILQQIGNLHLFQGQMDYELNRYTVHRNFLSMSFPFLALGFLLNRCKDTISHKIDIKLWHVIVVIILVIVESLANYFLISKTQSLDQMFSLFIAAPIIFLYFLNKKILGKNKELANLSTAIFLIHPFFIYHLKGYFLNQQTLFSLIVLVCSILVGLILVQMNKKIKYLL
ncbi:hypothetical protein B9T25_12135 [Acinetobacter sp. ANC 4470]|uniref:acyltransferase family protein n=1 Tax=Acinetobacter sp. ANC 4470 TaxID=1977881 RepID=UPI000A32E5F9|nr:acyltransferase family protein [Acinetobacter sp. ANC 4470]OTG65344.1 hypothetical protein B9T25_12135 [Acinetobacter sp. ANC 4470]